jgi:malic enzyme
VSETVPYAVRSLSEERSPIVIGDEEIFASHVGGKLSVALKAPLDTQRALSIAYTPGVAQVSRAIAADQAAAEAIFSVACDDLAPDRIVPSPLDPRVAPAVAQAVA